MIEQIFNQTEDRMKKTIEVTRQDLSNIRTGRASTKLLDGIKVDYYNILTPMNQLATISTPDARTISVQPWDKSSLEHIEKAIFKADLGLVPVNDGTLIRINIPALTEERRKEFTKLISKIAEEQKVAVRNIRRDANEIIKESKKKGELSEDESKKSMDKIQHLTDKYITEIEHIEKNKAHEIMEI